MDERSKEKIMFDRDIDPWDKGSSSIEQELNSTCSHFVRMSITVLSLVSRSTLCTWTQVISPVWGLILIYELLQNRNKSSKSLSLREMYNSQLILQFEWWYLRNNVQWSRKRRKIRWLKIADIKKEESKI